MPRVLRIETHSRRLSHAVQSLQGRPDELPGLDLPGGRSGMDAFHGEHETQGCDSPEPSHAACSNNRIRFEPLDHDTRQTAGASKKDLLERGLREGKSRSRVETNQAAPLRDQ